MKLSPSSCGYNTITRHSAYTVKVKSGQHTKGDQRGARRAPYDFTGCLAHANITYNEQSSKILRVIGYLEHNKACQASIMKRTPNIPLHSHVIKVALDQLVDGARQVPTYN
jgi:hypothetical protein